MPKGTSRSNDGLYTLYVQLPIYYFTHVLMVVDTFYEVYILI